MGSLSTILSTLEICPIPRKRFESKKKMVGNVSLHLYCLSVNIFMELILWRQKLAYTR